MRDMLEFKGRLVVTRAEGVRLGMTSGFVVDEAVGRISALMFSVAIAERRTSRLGDQRKDEERRQRIHAGRDLVRRSARPGPRARATEEGRSS